jgi:hypothetical protein
MNWEIRISRGGWVVREGGELWRVLSAGIGMVEGW